MKRTRTLRNFSLFHKIVAAVLAATIPLVTMPDLALALPHGGVVSKGQATLGYATGRLLVTQSTSSATFNWGSFNVKSGQSVVYRTPGASSVSLNYIGGTTPSSIDGTVTSNGILYFMNPNGLIFGSGSVVSATGVMAFGSATPWGKSTGVVSNAGVLMATDNGTVALVGTSVTNAGTITAPGGEVLLAAGSTVTPIAQANGASVSVVTTGGGTIDDSGILSAETVGDKTGQVTLQAGSQSGTVSLDSTAILDASAPTGGNGGTIETSASRVNVANDALVTTDASKGSSGTWTLDPVSFYIGMNTGSANTTKGNLLGYEDISGTTLGSLLQNGNIVIDSTSGANGSLGNIYVNGPISWSSSNSLTLNAVNNIEINSQIKNTVGSYANTQSLTGGGMTISYPNTPLLVLRADDMDIGGSATNTLGGVPSGVGSVYINSGGSLNVNGPVALYYNPKNYWTPTSFTNLGSGIMTAYMLLSSNFDLYYIDQNQTSQILSNNYALNSSFTLPSFGSLTNTPSDINQINFTSSANGVNLPSSSTYSNWIRFGGFKTGSYKGSFDGLNHFVSNMEIYDSVHISSGFFGYVTQGIISNFGISSGSIFASNPNVNYYDGGYGGFAGISGDNSIFKNDFSKVNITGAAWTGGFVGQLCPTAECGGTQAGVVMDSFSSGNVNNTGSVLYVDSGGFVGNNEGEIFNSYESGNISGENTVGGFAGIVSGNTYSSLIMNSYEIGNVEGGTYVGGFVGYDRGPGQIIDSFSSGTVHASSNKGGFSGSGGSMGNGNPVVTNSYWNKITSGLTSSYNGTGLTSSQFKSLNNFISWGFNSWDGNHWQDSITTDPWFMMTSGPVLIPDMPLEIIDGKSGTSQYTGATFSPGFVVTSTQGISPMTTDFSTSVGPNVGAYLNTPFISTLSAPTSQTSIGSYNENSGVYSITPATLTATANSASMTYGGTVPSLSGTVTGFVNGQTLAGDGGSATWSTSASSSSNAGQYGITGDVTLGSPYSGDYTITAASGNGTALTITAATSTTGGGSSGSSGTGSSGSSTAGGITTSTFTPVLQTVDLYQKLPSLPGNSSPGNSSNSGSSSPSPSGNSTTLLVTPDSSLTVIQPFEDDTTGDGILSVQELKQ